MPACKGDDTGFDTATTAAATGGSSGGATETPTTGGSSASSSSTADPTMTTPTTTATTQDGTSGPDCLNAALGGICVDPACDCASDACYVLGPLGGVCSECDEDADCASTTGFGCNPGNPLAGVPAVCSKTGTMGQGCETTDACTDGFACNRVFDVPGLFVVSTSSECTTDVDCPGKQCAPTYDIANFGGYYRCVDAGSVKDNEGCDLTGDGSECMSGHCAPASIMGIPVIGVCSPSDHPEDRGRVPASASGTKSFGGQRQCDLPERCPGLAELEHPRDGLLFVGVRHNARAVARSSGRCRGAFLK